MAKIPKRLGEILVEGRIVTENQLEHALDVQKKERKLLGEIIVKLGYITKDRLELALTRQFGSLLGEILVKNKFINFEELQAALAKQRQTNKPLGKILIGLGFIDEESLLRALSEKYKIPYVDLGRYNINTEAFEKVSIRLCRNANILPIDIEKDCLVIATATPEDIITEQNIKAITGMRVKMVITSAAEIKKRIAP